MMKVVNPVGRDVSNLETGANVSGGAGLLGCICDTGSKNTAVGYSCAQCGCQCKSGDNANKSANSTLANTSRNYVNV